MHNLAYSFLAFGALLAVLIVGIPLLVWKGRVLGRIARGILLLGWGMIVWGTFVEPYILVVRNFEINSPDLHKMKIAVVADFHVRPGKGSWWVEKVVDRINSIPDLDMVFIPGDFFNVHPDAYLEELEPLKNLQYPTYFTLGNHDHKLNGKVLDTRVMTTYLASLGLYDVNNASVQARKSWVSGIDDNYLGYDSLGTIEKGREDLLIAHSPDIVSHMLPGYDPKLVVSGHTHCGQIRFPWYGAIPGVIPTEADKKYERHLYEWDKGRFLFVTCGVGEVGPASRLFNFPEIAVLSVH